MTIRGIRRWVLFRPLAVLMAVLVLPVLSWLDGNGAGDREFRAAAQIIGGCSGAGTNKIIQNYCVGDVSYSSDLIQLETDAVNAYIGEHGLPVTDAHIIYDLGRSDLRTAVRAQMLSILTGIITKSPSLRTTHEQTLYTWLTTLVQQNEIALYTNALNQFFAWENDPCHFTLDPTVASAYNLSYDGASFCGSPLNGLFAGPPVPAESYFTSYGMRKSYAAPADAYPYFSALVARTGVDIGEIAGISTAVGVVLAGISSAVVANGVASAMQYFEAEIAVQEIAETPEILVGVESIDAVGSGVLATGPAAIILIAIAVDVTAGVQAFTSEQVINDLNNLKAVLNQVTNTPPNLVAFNADTTGQGSYKIEMSLVGQTVPEVASTAALPAHRSTDPSFSIQANGATNFSNTLNYKDWDGNTWSAQTWGGWFVQNCTSANCVQKDSIIGSIQYLDWSGAKYTLTRAGSLFVHTKGKPAATDVKCAPDSTGVTPGSNFSNCLSYTTYSDPLIAADGTQVTVSLSPLAPPTFTSSTLPFIPGVVSSQTVFATGNPTPSICYSSSNLPAGFSLNAGSCGQGTFQLTYNGTAPQGNYTLTLTASGAGTVTQTFTVAVTQQLSITSSATMQGTAGTPVNFLITTTGNPTPHLSLDPTFPRGGLSFKDNGDGTATFSGTPSTPNILFCLFTTTDPSKPAPPCGIIASNSQGTVEQAAVITLNPAPSAVVNAPLSTTFYAGVPNNTLITTGGAVTPVTWAFGANSATWASFHDNGDGTGTLSGTPPVGASGPFVVVLIPKAYASSTVNIPTNYTINVVDAPLFTTPNTLAFTTGGYSSFYVSATQGTVSALNSLPNGLSFASGTPSGIISGMPAAGTGGQYIIKLLDDAGAAGSTSQDLTLNVYDAPRVTSLNDAIFFAGVPGSFVVTTSGYPSISNHPLPPNPLAPTDPTHGDGMYFTAAGLPGSFNFNNLNSQGFATGTLSITGTPLPADVGTHKVHITAQNGVGNIAQQTLTLQVLPYNPTAPVNLLSNWILTRDSGNNIVATVVLANNGSAAAQNVVLASAKIGTATGTVLPAVVASIPAESTATFSILFPAASVGTHGSAGVLSLSGSYTGGTFNNAGRIILP